MLKIYLLILVLTVILAASFIYSRPAAGGQTMRASAGAAYQFVTRIKPKENLTIKSFTAVSKSADGFYRKGAPISFSCTIENSSDGAVGNFHSIIRTDKKEVARSDTKSLESRFHTVLSGTWTPDSVGVVFAACRTGADEHGKILSLYVFPVIPNIPVLPN